MHSSLKRLLSRDIGHISVATVYSGNDFVEKDVDGVTYFLLPLKGKSMTKYNRHLEPLWRQVKDRVSPDVIHIHGSEFPHGLAYVSACGGKGVVVSMQGIMSGYTRYYTSGMSVHDVRSSLTFRDVIRQDSLIQQQDKFRKQGILEAELLGSISHVIGRTNWDRAHALAINPSLKYHYCGETLRDEFYRHRWNYESCVPHTVFVSQAGYPIKGLHILLQAMPLVLRRFPDAQVYVAGGSPLHAPWYRLSGYGKYLKRMVRRLGLRDKIIFTGSLDEKQMCRQYLRCNVFVCCSAIENSPNSLGEAQLLGVPYLASFVGGIPEIVNNNMEVLYRFEEYEILAEKICSIFEKGPAACGAEFDHTRYDGEKNIQLLESIYRAMFQI